MMVTDYDCGILHAFLRILSALMVVPFMTPKVYDAPEEPVHSKAAFVAAAVVAGG